MNRYFLFDDNDDILLRLEEGHPTIPDDSDVAPGDLGEAHAFSADEWVARIPATSPLASRLTSLPLRSTAALLPHADYQRAGKARELLYWSDHCRFCSTCGGTMQWHTTISRICTRCGLEVWPQLGIAIIVLVHKGDSALLVKARTFRRDFFGLVAGFVETGESLEECVAREVKEETSLTISNIRYAGSQPWPYPLGLMAGFHADWAGGDITFADGELKDGNFFTRDTLPRHADGTLAIPGPESMARILIDQWLNDANQ